MIFSVHNPVICDWLSLTYKPDTFPLHDLRDFLLDSGFLPAPVKKASYAFQVKQSDGLILVFANDRFMKIETRGGALSYLRSLGILDRYLFVLSSVPHHITRLDAAQDQDLSYDSVRSLLHKSFPDYRASLGRKSVDCVEVGTTKRVDGLMTGTYYMGARGHKQFVRVYDRQQRLFGLSGELGPLQTRIEAEVAREFNASLKDAADPTSLFYHVCGDTLFTSSPDHVKAWEPVEELGWVSDPRRQALPFDRLVSAIARSVELPSLVDTALHSGHDGKEIAPDAAYALVMRQLSLGVSRLLDVPLPEDKTHVIGAA